MQGRKRNRYGIDGVDGKPVKRPGKKNVIRQPPIELAGWKFSQQIGSLHMELVGGCNGLVAARNVFRSARCLHVCIKELDSSNTILNIAMYVAF